MLLLTLFSVESAAKTLDSVEVDVCIFGGDNHFVYKILKQLHHSTAYDEMKDRIEKRCQRIRKFNPRIMK